LKRRTRVDRKVCLRVSVVVWEPFQVRPPDAEFILFRIIEDIQAAEGDFLSDEWAGKARDLRTSLAIHRGFSCRATLNQARSLGRLLEEQRGRKQYVAEFVLEAEEGDAVARTFKTRGHHTVWANQALAHRRVRDVHEV
jgi:hypothetical protein